MPPKHQQYTPRSPRPLSAPHCQPGGFPRTCLDGNTHGHGIPGTHRHPTSYTHIPIRRARHTQPQTWMCRPKCVPTPAHARHTQPPHTHKTTQTHAHPPVHTLLYPQQCTGQTYMCMPPVHSCLSRPGPTAVHTKTSIHFLSQPTLRSSRHSPVPSPPPHPTSTSKTCRSLHLLLTIIEMGL